MTADIPKPTLDGAADFVTASEKLTDNLFLRS